MQHCRNCCFLIEAEGAGEIYVNGAAGSPLIFQVTADAVVRQQCSGGIEATSRQGNMLRIIFRATNDAWLIPQSHVQGMHAAHRAKYGGLDVLWFHGLDGIQESPLIGVGG